MNCTVAITAVAVLLAAFAYAQQNLRGKGCPGHICDGIPDDKFAVKLDTAADATEKCMCLTSLEGDCNCKGCSEKDQISTCHELLGPCQCDRSENAICDCHGYCHKSTNRQDACQEEPGCEWTGMWCQAQIGLLWD